MGNTLITKLRCNTQTIDGLSDSRDKKEIMLLSPCLNFVKLLKPVKFTWNMRPTISTRYNRETGLNEEIILPGLRDHPDIGFTAQDLNEAQTSANITIPGLVNNTNPDKLEASYGKLLPVLVKVIQELSAKIETLETEVAALKLRVA